MKRAVVLLLVLVAAGCGGQHNTKKPGVKAGRPVTKPLARPLIVKVKGSVTGTAFLRPSGNAQTSVQLKLAHAAKGLTAELDKGACRAPKCLRLTKPLGPVRSASSGWSVTAPLSKLTASPLAVVVRRAGKIAGCGNVGSG